MLHNAVIRVCQQVIVIVGPGGLPFDLDLPCAPTAKEQ